MVVETSGMNVTVLTVTASVEGRTVGSTIAIVDTVGWTGMVVVAKGEHATVVDGAPLASASPGDSVVRGSSWRIA